ncbi:MAG: ABC transporter ATP-binding protein [Desulfosarcinaceae bacterium]|nr:ABC transporter ATP-binding protein [Desulfosarcinaceae bacterium]
MALAMLCMLLMATASAAIPFLIKNVVDDIFVQRNAEMLRLLPLVVILIYTVLGTSMYGQEYLMSYVGQDIVRHLRDRLYARIQAMPIAFFHAHQTGVLMSRVTNDVNIIRNMVSSAITGSLRDVFTIVGLICVIFYRDWKMALAALVILPVAYFPIVALGRRVRRATGGGQEAFAEMNTQLHETFAGNKIVKAFGQEEFEKERFIAKTGRLFRLEMKAVRYKALTSPVMESLAGVGVAFVIWYGGSKVISGASTAGTFFSFMAAVLMLYGPVKKLSKLNSKVQAGLVGVDRVFDILEAETVIPEAEKPKPLPRRPHSVIFEKVSFRYESELVLEEIDVAAAPGENLALVGMSGGGKTSLVNLIPRFYDVCAGAVRIDDLDVRDLSLAELRSQIAIVTQEPILFNESVRDNIAYGNRSASEIEIIDAAKAAFAHDFIMNFPQGMDTRIGELGSRLSGGEKQRICIARALLKDAPILILDEATSALDAQAETLVQKALENLMRGRTTFIIAHRLSTIDFADRILVLKQGRIVEQGTQQELLAKGGIYRDLHDMQFKPNASDRQRPAQPI